jgi:hypothetical protein
MVNTSHIKQLFKIYFSDIWTTEHLNDYEYLIQPDGTIQVPNNNLYMRKPTSNGMLPVKFGIVGGSFILDKSRLTTLQGAPTEVWGDFNCSKNLLPSLVHAPAKVHGHMDCSYNNITSLEHCPTVGILDCSHNLLTDLTHAPPCDQLYAHNNPMESFKHTPDHIGTVVISYGATLPLLGLLSVPKIELETTNDFPNRLAILPIERILNKYTRQGRAGQLKCAAELVRAGYKDNARW